MAFAFEKSDQFALNKKSGSPCPKLDDKGMCTIHDDLASSGFRGCARYTCFGAGQRVTEEVFGGQNWQQDRALLSPMLECFFIMARAHELLVILAEATKMDLSDAKRESIAGYIKQLNPASGWDVARLHSFAQSSLEHEIREFFTSLRHVI